MNIYRLSQLGRYVSAAILALASGLAVAQAAYPSKPIRIIVPFAAGGTADNLPRALGAILSQKYGQPVVIENKPGAASMLGAEYVAKSPADGHTLLLATSSTLAVVPNLYKKMRYDSGRDLVSVSLLATSPSILMVSNDVPANNFKEFIDYVKQRPGQVSFASAGVGGVIHLHSELFQSQTGTRMIHVPYQGSNLALGDLQTGRVQMLIDIIGSNYGTVSQNKVKVLASMSEKRLPLLPQVPSVAELDIRHWPAIFGSPSPPRPRRRRPSFKSCSRTSPKSRAHAKSSKSSRRLAWRWWVAPPARWTPSSSATAAAGRP